MPLRDKRNVGNLNTPELSGIQCDKENHWKYLDVSKVVMHMGLMNFSVYVKYSLKSAQNASNYHCSKKSHVRKTDFNFELSIVAEIVIDVVSSTCFCIQEKEQIEKKN